MKIGGLTRRDFLKTSSTATLALSLSALHFKTSWASAGQEILMPYKYRGWEDIYRQKWDWDKVAKGAHLVGCLSTCPFNVYVKDGIVLREEQVADHPLIEPGVPDFNPWGCQKGLCHSSVMYSPERIRYPLKRVGGRGAGKWRRLSWDEALTEIADAIIDAIQEVGPDSIIMEAGTNGIGYVHGGYGPGGRLLSSLGGILLDPAGLLHNDYPVGLYETFGTNSLEISVDGWFHSDLLLIWHMNPAYTRIPFFHYLTEARYNGTEVISIAPDYNASSIHADEYISVELGTDAALALALCKVLLDEGLYDEDFIQEQTDLPLLVRKDTRKFLRESDLKDGGKEDQFYFFDVQSGKEAEVPRGTLRIEGEPSLEGEYKLRLKDNKEVEVQPVFALLKDKLKSYEPEEASKICGVQPETIRMLAHKVAGSKTLILVGLSAPKYYHGDLMQRAMCLLLALTGNWGKKGAGITGWNLSLFEGGWFHFLKRRPGVEGWTELMELQEGMAKQVRAEDPTLTEEMVAIELVRQGPKVFIPPIFLLYYHAGYKDVWNKQEWADPSMPRGFASYMEESVKRGWWEGLARPDVDKPPRVFIQQGGSILRKTAGGLKQLLRHLWPKLRMVVTIDWRMSTTALYSDIILPAALYYEKVDFQLVTTATPFLTFTDKAVAPIAESKPEYEIYCLLAKKVAERAKEMEFTEYKDPFGNIRRLDILYAEFTRGGAFTERDEEKIAEEMLEDSVRVGILPPGTNLEMLRKKGYVRFCGLGKSAGSLGVAADIKPDETLSGFTWHVEKKLSYATLTRRAQFYIDHDWFIEAGEELPVHKPNPTMGGDYPFRMTSGHQRWSIHSCHVVNKLMLRSQRGVPVLFVNPGDAERKGIRDHDEVRVFNDFESFKVHVTLSPSVRPGQVIIYHAWEPYQFRDHKSPDTVIPGMVKWLHLAGGYGHLKYRPFHWYPRQESRSIPVDIEKI